MTLDKFIQTYKVGKSYDFEKTYKGECVSLAKNYIKDVLEIKPQSIGNAKEYWNKRNVEYIKNNFEAVSGKAKRGDLFIRTTGTYGHIGIVLTANDKGFTTIEQNKGNCRVVTNEMYSYNSDIHFLRPKNQKNIAEPVKVTPVKKPTAQKVTYYPQYKGKSLSLVDALASLKIDSSLANRKKIAKANGITNYTGTATQNIKLLNLLKQGKLKK